MNIMTMEKLLQTIMLLALMVLIFILALIKNKEISIYLDNRYSLPELLKVPEEEVDSCMRWAFGEDWEQLEMRMFDERWRQLHPDLFVMHGHDSIAESLNKVGREWGKLTERNEK